MWDPLGEKVLIFDVRYKNVISFQTQERSDFSFLVRANNKIIVENIPLPIPLFLRRREFGSRQEFISDLLDEPRHSAVAYHDERKGSLVAGVFQRRVAVENISSFQQFHAVASAANPKPSNNDQTIGKIGVTSPATMLGVIVGLVILGAAALQAKLSGRQF
jgi:hypothetical protein